MEKKATSEGLNDGIAYTFEGSNWFYCLEEEFGSGVHYKNQQASIPPLSNALERVILRLTNSIDGFMGEQKVVNEQLSQGMDHLEKSQGELAQRMEDMGYTLSGLVITYFTQESDLMEEGNFVLIFKEDAENSEKS